MAKRRKSKKEQTVIRNIFVIAVIIIALLYFLDSQGILKYDTIQTGLGLRDGASSDAEVSVHYIDVGQGDCELILIEKSVILIDAGEAQYGEKVVSYLKAQGVTRLDYVIATHPHSDHIGGMTEVLKTFEVDTLYMPLIPDEMVPTGYSYENFLTAMIEKNVNFVELDSEEKLSINGVSVEIYPPVEEYNNLNNYSLITRMTHGSNTFLFTGDAEKQAENALLKSKIEVSAMVYKAGHHGSNTSSNEDFLKAVMPQICIISCGAGNSYNHPGDKAVERISKYAEVILRTDISGTIVIESDGKSVSYKVEKG